MTDPISLTISEEADNAAEAFIGSAIRNWNIAQFGESNKRDLNILLRHDDGTVTGGLMGHTARGWLFVALLFVPEALRGQGLARRLLILAEEEARRRGCLGAMIDTMNPDALRLYRKAGYDVSGASPAFDSGHCITWLAKRFEA
ncbi:MAG: GNAT family N-acetyltransferase [Shinella sp.]|nr:MAG: GNAT family N-acetyltransferase [Shinella sp.]